MKNNPFHQFFVHKLKDIASAENQILEALPKMIKAATDPELVDGFKMHLKQTEGHVERLEKIGKMLDETMSGVKCHGMQGIVAEGAEVIKKELPAEVKDAALIAAAQVVEHYEMANYGTLVAWAQVMGHDEVAQLLQETLDEESETNEKLTDLAETVNPEAFEQDES